MTYKFFITGTDTNIGKTYISIGLIKKFQQSGFRTLGLKPIASGGKIIDGKIYNEDALCLQKHSSKNLDYDLINPFCFLPPISPNIAAERVKLKLTVEDIYQKIYPTINGNYEVYIVEGVGGWKVPLNDQETLADLVYKLNIPIILVIGIRLGCINHSILTYESILNKNLMLKGWVANCLGPTNLENDANIETLKQYIKAPCLGVVGLNQQPEEMLDITPLL
ncbi:dethiobiotin synthase [Rickettsiales endosymbiont of Stachyamoeba lipophora]|uniref:dethiobiotin synthase n=1 Tax=Rickettsiales endosymbiont of Stachyamoeba lipophora TaxID=2486578 RepID=UPI000F64F446|nr:dethiobiotin synthase [Rickettsiales endosymbiont of Stachyamoeba lipophora]AZL16079.1 dethiobiotin synthase [Rickettsiales endosymbiont of Stachyamoeba lipophora]